MSVLMKVADVGEEYDGMIEDIPEDPSFENGLQQDDESPSNDNEASSASLDRSYSN